MLMIINIEISTFVVRTCVNLCEMNEGFPCLIEVLPCLTEVFAS